MTVDEFLAWAEEQEGRYELYHGHVFAMSPERAGHAPTKFAVQRALANGIREAGLPCTLTPRVSALPPFGSLFACSPAPHYSTYSLPPISLNFPAISSMPAFAAISGVSFSFAA